MNGLDWTGLDQHRGGGEKGGYVSSSLSSVALAWVFLHALEAGEGKWTGWERGRKGRQIRKGKEGGKQEERSAQHCTARRYKKIRQDKTTKTFLSSPHFFLPSFLFHRPPIHLYITSLCAACTVYLRHHITPRYTSGQNKAHVHVLVGHHCCNSYRQTRLLSLLRSSRDAGGMRDECTRLTRFSVFLSLLLSSFSRTHTQLLSLARALARRTEAAPSWVVRRGRGREAGLTDESTATEWLAV